MRNPVTADADWDRQAVVSIARTPIETAVWEALAELQSA